MAEKDSAAAESLASESSNDKEAGKDNIPPSQPSDQALKDDQYPHGLRLIILAGASIVAVFLIALDQVSTISVDIRMPFKSLTPPDHCRHRDS